MAHTEISFVSIVDVDFLLDMLDIAELPMSVLLLLILDCTVFLIGFLFFVHINPFSISFSSEYVLGL